jgi:hypothetical protein
MGTLNGWDVIDANNDDAPPDGWPENTMNYSDVNNTGRAVQGTLKRFFADINGSLVGAGVADAYTVTLNETGYVAYFTGMLFKCSLPAANTTTTPTLNVNAIGAVTIVNNEGGAVRAGDLATGGVYEFLYDGTNFRVSGGLGGDVQIQGSPNANRFAVWVNSTTLSESLDVLSLSEGPDRVIAGNAGNINTGVSINASVTGNPVLEWQQNGVNVSTFTYQNAGDTLDLQNPNGVIRFAGNGVSNIFQADQDGLDFLVDSDIRLNEASDHQHAAQAGRGILWVRDDVPNTLMFTDDAGSDFEVGGALANNELSVFKTVDESVANSTTLQDDDELQVTLAANATYTFEALIVVEGDSAGDFDFRLTEADGTYQVVSTGGTAAAGGGVSGGTIRVWSHGHSADITLALITGDVSLIRIHGSIESAGAGGIFKLEWAQATSNATPTTVKAGSYFKVRRVV